MLDIDPKKLEALIVKEAADQLLSSNDDGRGKDQFSRYLDEIRGEINRRIDKLFAERVEAIILSEINKAVEAGFERDFQEYDQFGGKVGVATSIRKRLVQLVSDYWGQRVDRQGKPTADTYGSTTRAEWVLVQSLGNDFAKEFKQHTANAAGEIKDGLRLAMRDWIDKSLGEVFNVRSRLDTEEARRK